MLRFENSAKLHRWTSAAAFSVPLAEVGCDDDDDASEAATACTGGLKQPAAGRLAVINPG